MKFIFQCYITLVVFCSCHAQPVRSVLPDCKDDNSLLWEVNVPGKEGPSYLFGTFHLLCKTDIRFSDNFIQALLQSDQLYLEMNLDDPSVMLGGLLLMNMNGGKTLEDLLPLKEYDRLKHYFEDSLGMPIALVKRMKPMMLESLLYPRMMPCKQDASVDMEIMKLAKKNKKEIKGLETIEFQSSVFDSIPYEVQAKELMKNIDSLPQYRVYFDSLRKIYLSQHLEELAGMLIDPMMGGEDKMDILLDKRNANWLRQLEMIMKKKRVFVAVGAGHLVGEKGLINLLRRKGYKVRPVMN